MRATYAVLLILTITLAGVHWYTTEGSVCRVPVEWRIGDIDGRFTITEAEAKAAVETATWVWEEAAGRDLFVYDEESDFTVNFVFDERQQITNAADSLKNKLDEKQQANEELTAAYDALVQKYEEQQTAFESQRNAFDSRLAAYNQEVAKYNNGGGAPEEAFERLETTKNVLDTEQRQVSAALRSLNALGEEINQLGLQGNALVEKYNESVNRFNEDFGYREGFTQGDYQGDLINIYEFQDIEELTLVLAHELGHALSFDHVENESSIMYFEMGEQSVGDIKPTAEDLAQFNELCSIETTADRFKNWLAARL